MDVFFTENKLQQRLTILALEAQTKSYAPYSNFRVGSAILGDNGQMYSGCNVENAAFPSGQCAEATAIGMMVMDGCQKIKSVVVASPNDDFCYPCGNCRQKISEFCDPDTTVTMVTQSGKSQTVTMAELLPFAFTPSDLDK